MNKIIYSVCIVFMSVYGLADAKPKTSLLNQPNLSQIGTVDGGGGNSALLNNKKTLLDLAEKLKFEPFDYSYAKILRIYDKDVDQSVPVVEGLNRIEVFSRLQFPIEDMKRLLGSENEFFVWAFHEAMRANSQKFSEYYDNSLYEIQSSAYNLLGNDKIKNVQYVFSDHELPVLNDSGVISISNPDTKKQLALQDRNGLVVIDKNEFDMLDLEGQLALKIHETILYLVLKYNPKLHEQNGTKYIREFTSNLFYYQIYKDTVKALSADIVKESYEKLQLPKFRPDYSMITKMSIEKKEDLEICEIANAQNTNNYIFTLNDQVVAGPYLMDSDFFMKIQMYLLKNDICRFQAQKCKIESVKMPWEQQPSFRFTRGDLKLFDKSSSIIELRKLFYKKYQNAQICE